MSETMFTPGPWSAIDFAGNDLVVTAINDSGRESIALLGSHSTKRFTNAYLIAAAPDMYEALEDILQLASTETTRGELVYIDFTEIRDVLKKARGET